MTMQDKTNSANAANPDPLDRPMLQEVFRQNWENVRHIKNERLMFTNIYAVVTAGALAFTNAFKEQSHAELFMLLFLLVFSVIGLLTSLRLKVELEECLANIERILVTVKQADFMSMGADNQSHLRYPKFRWVFPIFYALTTAVILAVLLHRGCQLF